MNKNIANVVFYKFYGELGAMQQACIFYTDGTVKNVSYDEGLDATMVIAKEEKIKNKEQLNNFINNKRIHVMSGNEYESRFQEFIMKAPKSEKSKKELSLINPNKDIAKTEENNNFKSVVTTKDKIVDSKKKEAKYIPKHASKEGVDFLVNNTDEPETVDIDLDEAEKNNKKKKSNIVVSDEEDEDFDVLLDDEEDEDDNKKKKGFFRRAIDKIKHSKVARRLIAFGVALAVGLGLYSCAAHQTKEGQMVNSNFEQSQTNNDKANEGTVDSSKFASMSFNELVTASSNNTQKTMMQAVGTGLDNFNETFAEAHLESGKDVKAALSWDEMVALKLAYNNYSRDELKVMFNGAELDQTTLSNSYKMATLQLMGAYVIETRDSQVNSSALVDSEEGKAFVEKYNEMFLQCKEATGQDQINKVNALYTELYKDFPIADEVREEGIAHSDARESLESYKLAVTPIVAATEMMFQNLEIDHTLSDKAVDYFNDLGLCNLADVTFNKAAIITMTAQTDEELPLYEQYKAAKIKELKEQNRYVIDDAHRDLSQLDEFQKWVNGHFDIVDGVFTGTTSYNTTTSTSTETHSTSSTTYRTETTKEETSDRDYAVNKTSEEEVKAAEDAVDQQIDQENQAAKDKAEQEAEQKRQEEQQKADEDAAKKEEEVKQDDADLQDKIDEANDQINDNNKDQDTSNDTPVNEDDFGDHDVDFDDDHSDENGNLDDSVQDVTTDDSNVKDETDLPDPNQTGTSYDEGSNSVVNEPAVEVPTGPENGTSTTTDSGEEIYEYEEPVTQSNEEIVNEYVESLDGGEVTTEEAIQYTK